MDNHYTKNVVTCTIPIRYKRNTFKVGTQFKLDQISKYSEIFSILLNTYRNNKSSFDVGGDFSMFGSIVNNENSFESYPTKEKKDNKKNNS